MSGTETDYSKVKMSRCTWPYKEEETSLVFSPHRHLITSPPCPSNSIVFEHQAFFSFSADLISLSITTS
jgi:hypothetical protein